MSSNNAQSVPSILYGAEKEHWWFKARRKIADKIFWAQTKKKSLQVLSVGCGTGQELHHISKYASVKGIDIDPEVVAFCKKQNFDVECTDILSSSLKKESFDIVVAMDVIEHIKDDKAALRAIHSLLKPGGRFFVTVPACMFLWSKFDELGEFPHYRRYSYNSLKTLLEANGFKKKYLSYYNFFLFPIAYIVRKFFSNNASEQLEPSQGRIHSFFEKILSSERFILPYLSFPIGVSLIGVFEKEE